jgi:hypothetical protein
MPSRKLNLKLHTFSSPKFKSVVREAMEFFSATPIHKLPPSGTFAGSGIYALYYSGNFGPYKSIAVENERECNQPIYVGKTVPPGWRTGRAPKSGETGALRTRLHQHANSIKLVRSLRLQDFKCRFMILKGVEADLTAAIEAELIRTFQPLWNTRIDGFGNHDPGKGRYDQARSEWDLLHPGRKWVVKLKGKSPSRMDVLAKFG